MLAETVTNLARECGFELAGIAAAAPLEDFKRYRRWADEGMAGAMGYLTDRRGDLRSDPRNLLPTARSVICVGKLYNTPDPARDPGSARVSRYAWGEDYHTVMRQRSEGPKVVNHQVFEILVSRPIRSYSARELEACREPCIGRSHRLVPFGQHGT